MRLLRPILLVAVLTAVFTAAGVYGVRSLLPRTEEARPARLQADDSAGELPRACLDELATIENVPLEDVKPANTSAVSASDAAGKSGRTLQQVVDEAQGELRILSAADERAASPNPLSRDSVAAARPMVSSAIWSTDAAEPRSSRRSQRPRTTTMAVSVDEPAPMPAIGLGKTVDALELMRRLRSEQEGERLAARRELMRRGFSEVDLELARQLFSPDMEARKQLAGELPRLGSVDASKWLMWLAADPQPEVRAAAIGTLATTADPALLDRAEALARKDADPQVKSLAERIARQRDMATRDGGTLR